MFMFDVGRAHVLDTYLTPITYRGVGVRLGYEHSQVTKFAPSAWLRQLAVDIEYNPARNAAKNNTMHDATLQARFGMMRRWEGLFHPNLQLMVGPMTQLRGGGIYNGANSNNVVSVKAHWAVGAQGMAIWKTHWGAKPLSFRYNAALPIVGVFFSPEYDESYYEIYLGNHKHLAHCGWWGNRFDLTQSLCADLRLGGTILRIGYRNRLERSWVNHLNTHITTHSFVIGIGGEFFTRGPHYNDKAPVKSVY